MSLGPVRFTYFGRTLAQGGCQMPQGAYEITDAMALGSARLLGPLKWRPGLCGMVLDVDCGFGRIPSIVIDKW